MTQPNIEPMENPGAAAAAHDVFAEANRANKQESAHTGEVLSGFGSSSQSRATGSKALASMSDIALFLRWLGDKSAKMPTITRFYLVGAILYAIMPFDLIWDVFPGFGVIDDAVVLGLLIGNLRSMIHDYRDFLTNPEGSRVSDLPPNL